MASSRVLQSIGRPFHRAAALAIALLTASGLAVAVAPASDAAPSTITTGATMTDQNGNVLQLHGLGIVKVGSTYYGFGENKTGEVAGQAPFQAISCYSSTNLTSWSYIGDALSQTASGDLGPNRIVERPKVIYNDSTGQYVMYLHIDNEPDYTEAKVGVATSPTPCGPYTYLGSSRPLGQLSRDIGLFKDTDGTAYLLSEDRAHGLQIDQLSSDYLSVVSSVATLADYEAPAMVKVSGRYYLLGSQLTGWSTNDNAYTTATSLSGPWSNWANFAPAGTSTYDSQTANIITVQGSAGTTYIYAGDRWNPDRLGTSELVWLPLTISGTSVSLPYHRAWSLDATAGTWSTVADGATRIFKGVGSGRCLDVTGASTAVNVADEIWDCNGQTNQLWQIHDDGSLTSVQSGLCMDVAGGNGQPGGKIIQYTCNSQTNQKWVINPDGSVVGVGSDLCLDVTGAAVAKGTPVETWTCNGQTNQKWTAWGAPALTASAAA